MNTQEATQRLDPGQRQTGKGGGTLPPHWGLGSSRATGSYGLDATASANVES